MSVHERTSSTWLADLKDLERGDLLTLWAKAYGSPPFKGARRGTLLRGVSYAEQAKREGGLAKRTKHKLIKLATGKTASGPTSCKSASSSSLPKTQLGTELVREWNGKTYTVHVTDKGCVLNGVTYGSLSAVAKAITGAHWSGPRFFGVSG